MQPNDCSTTPWFLRRENQPAWLCILVLLAFAVVASLSVWRALAALHDPAVDNENQGLIDFHNVVYFPAVAFREGVNPYSAEYAARYPVNRQYPLYSPAIFWLHCPLSILPLGAGNVIYYIASFSMVILLAVSVLFVCRLPQSLCNIFGLTTLILVSRPGHINLLLGQVTLPMALGTLWALHFARRRPGLAGLALAITTLKPTFGVPLVWLMFCRRDFRAVFAGVIIAGAAAAGGLAPIIANHGLNAVLESLAQSQSLHEDDPIVAPVTTWTRIDAVALIGKAIGREPEAIVALSVAASCLLVAGLAVWRTSRAPMGDGADSVSALIIVAATLACIYHSTYDALILVGPWVGASAGRLREQLPHALLPVVWLLLTFPAVNYLSARIVTRALSIGGPLWTTLTMLNSLSILAVLFVSIWVALRSKACASPLGTPALAAPGA